jgi:hypothetical protein
VLVDICLPTLQQSLTWATVPLAPHTFTTDPSSGLVLVVTLSPLASLTSIDVRINCDAACAAFGALPINLMSCKQARSLEGDGFSYLSISCLKHKLLICPVGPGQYMCQMMGPFNFAMLMQMKHLSRADHD